MRCTNCGQNMIERERDLYACRNCGSVIDCTYSKDVAGDGRKGFYKGLFRYADYYRIKAGEYHIVIENNDGSGRQSGTCIDMDKTMSICEVWVSEGRIGAGFQKEKNTP